MLHSFALLIASISSRGFQNPASAGQVLAIVNAAQNVAPPVLVRIPFSPSSTYIDEVGSTAGFHSGFLENSDGTGTGLNVSVPNSSADYVKIWVMFQGTTFGVRWRYSSASTFSVQVDGGLIRRVQNADGYRTSEARNSSLAYEIQQITHTHLASGTHIAQIMFSANQSAILDGLVVDEIGKAPLIYRAAVPGYSGTVGNGPSAVALFLPYNAAQSSSSYFSWTGKITYSNWTASAINLYFSNVGNTVTGATNATPIVVTTSSAHGLTDGQPVYGYNVGGNTAANVLGFAKVSTYSTTTFGLYQDPGLTTGVAGNSAWTSGGTFLTLVAQYSIPANGSLDINFTQPVMAAMWNQFASAPGLTYLPFGGYYN